MSGEDYWMEELSSNVRTSGGAQVHEVMDVGGQQLASSNKEAEAEGALIKKFVCGEVGFQDVFKLEPEEEEGDSDDEQPSTSARAAPKSERVRHSFSEDQVDTDLGEGGGGGCGGRQQRGRGGPARKRPVLNAALQGLMGEANLRFARGQIETAEKICLEIIRQNPFAPEPFFTLAEIYETRDKEKYLNFLTIAAHLNPHDRDQWIRIAEMHISQGNMQRARVYYTKAIKVINKDYDLRLRKARLLEMMGESNAAMLAYLKMIPLVPPDRAELCLATAKNVARHFHELGKTQLALEAMEGAYSVCPYLFAVEDLNLYMELLITNKSYEKVVRCLRERTNLELETDKENNLELIFFCVIPDDYLPDIRAKLCVSLIHLHAHHLLGYLVSNIHEHVPLLDERLDLYIDVAEALMAEHKYAEAIELLRPITAGDVIDCPAFVWLRHAECLRHLNRTNEAIDAFMRVVELAPYCYEAKFTLSALLKQMGRNVEAVKALEQSDEGDGKPLNARLLYERCIMLQQIGEIDEFLEVGYTLLSRHSIKLRNREEMLAAANGGSFYNADGLKVILQMRNITEDTDLALQEYNKPAQENSDLNIQNEYHLFLELVRTAFKCRKYGVIERLCFAMVTTKRFVGFHIELERIIILACYFNDDCPIAFSYLRELITKNCHNVALWNLLSLLVQKGQDLRYHRYIRRLVDKHPSARQMRLFLAHYHLHSSSFKYALNIYVPILKEQRLPLVALCISAIFNQLSMQKKVLRKPAAVAQAIAFAERYAVLRTGGATLGSSEFEASAACQEIYYNIGRIYHQAGIMHLAMHYYERGLAASHPLIEANLSTLDLRPEIAFNLHLIYRASGNLRKARQYLYQYCEV